MRAVPRLPGGVLTILLMMVVGCGDASGPESEFMTAMLNGTPWTAGSPMAWVTNGKLAFTGNQYVSTAERSTSISVFGVPLALGAYVVKHFDATLSEPSCMVDISTGSLDQPGEYKSVWGYSDSGMVVIESLDATWVSGTFWFAASGAPATHYSVTDGDFRIRIEILQPDN